MRTQINPVTGEPFLPLRSTYMQALMEAHAQGTVVDQVGTTTYIHTTKGMELFDMSTRTHTLVL